MLVVLNGDGAGAWEVTDNGVNTVVTTVGGHDIWYDLLAQPRITEDGEDDVIANPASLFRVARVRGSRAEMLYYRDQFDAAVAAGQLDALRTDVARLPAKHYLYGRAPRVRYATRAVADADTTTHRYVTALIDVAGLNSGYTIDMATLAGARNAALRQADGGVGGDEDLFINDIPSTAGAATTTAHGVDQTTALGVVGVLYSQIDTVDDVGVLTVDGDAGTTIVQFWANNSVLQISGPGEDGNNTTFNVAYDNAYTYTTAGGFTGGPDHSDIGLPTLPVA